MNKNTAGFSFDTDSELLISRSENVNKTELTSKGSKADRMAFFMRLHAKKAQSVQARTFS